MKQVIVFLKICLNPGALSKLCGLTIINRKGRRDR